MLMFPLLSSLFPDGKHLPVLSIAGPMAAGPHCASKKSVPSRSTTLVLIGPQEPGSTCPQ